MPPGSSERFVRGYRSGKHLLEKMGPIGFRATGPVSQLASMMDATLYSAPRGVAIPLASLVSEGIPGPVRVGCLDWFHEWQRSLVNWEMQLTELKSGELPDYPPVSYGGE